MLPRTRSDRARHPAAPVLLAALALLIGLGACTQIVEYHGASAHELHSKRVLLLQPSLLTPTSEALHHRVVEQIETAMADSPELGPVTRREALRREDMPLRLRDAYEQFSNTISLAGIADPELSRRLGEGLEVDLLAVAQPSWLPCPVCEDGDRLYLVGQVVDAASGRLVFRAHVNAQATDSTPEALVALADELTRDYLDALERAFRLRPHRERFFNLKRMGEG